MNADLRGHLILIVEGDYDLASDTVRLLREAGAEIVGPCPSERAALAAIGQRVLTGALVNINLGAGPSFEVAKTLRSRNVPFVLVTNGDAAPIPAEFASVTCLEEPVERDDIASSLARALGAAF
jgi:DNA-binding NtrC family response regulator